MSHSARINTTKILNTRIRLFHVWPVVHRGVKTWIKTPGDWCNYNPCWLIEEIVSPYTELICSRRKDKAIG